jgi:hypothetical protein
MFAKLAQMRLRGVGNLQQAPATDGNRLAFRPLAHSTRTRRPTLVCDWRQARGTGVLECVWRSIAAPATAEPRAEQLTGQVRRLKDDRAAARHSLRRTAA